MRNGRRFRCSAALTALAMIGVPSPGQADLLGRLGDLRRSAEALRSLQKLELGEATALLVAAYAATPNSQAGLVGRRRALFGIEAAAAHRPVPGAVLDELAAGLDATEDARRIEAVLAALGVLVPRCADRAAGERAIAVAEEQVLRLWHSDEARWTSGEPSTPLIEGFRAIARMRVPVDTPLERLEALLAGPDPLVRETAAERLVAHGVDALPSLRQALTDDHPELARGTRVHVVVPGDRFVPIAAVRAIARIDIGDPDAAEGLLWYARYGLGHQRLDALTGLGNPALGRRDKVVHALILEARGDDDRLALEAITALGALGPSAERAIAALQMLASDPRSSRSGPAKAALARVRD